MEPPWYIKIGCEYTYIAAAGQGFAVPSDFQSFDIINPDEDPDRHTRITR